MAAFHGKIGLKPCAAVRKKRWMISGEITLKQSNATFFANSFSSNNGAPCINTQTIRELKIVGDVPIFVAYDSADAWSHPELFYLDKNGNPTVVAGVPPDYFSKTGQLWGNPIYRWDVHKSSGYTWWIQRIQATLQMVDIIRLDHFRGFAGYWEVPANKLTAEVGRWMPGPGASLFELNRESFGWAANHCRRPWKNNSGCG